MQKARDRDPGNPDAGVSGSAGGADSGHVDSPGMDERRRQIEERRQSILEKNRLRREQLEAERRLRSEGRTPSRGGSADAGPDAHVSGSDTAAPDANSHISGAPTSPDSGHQAPDAHVSGN